MKKQLFFLLTLVVATFAFVSCSNDDDDNQYDPAILLNFVKGMITPSCIFL